MIDLADTDRLTTHHLLFPRGLWRYSEKYRKLRSSFTIRLTQSAHEQFNKWADQNIGFIPAIPPKELDMIWARLIHQHGEGFLKAGTLQSRLANFLAAIRAVADASNIPTVKIIMILTWENLRLQAEFLGIFPETTTKDEKE